MFLASKIRCFDTLYLGQYLRILVVEAPPFVIVRNISTSSHSWNSVSNIDHVNYVSMPLKTKHSGVVIYRLVADLIRELHMRMHFNYTIEIANLSTSYHSLVGLLTREDRQYDIILSDIRITSGRLLTIDFSTPFHENSFRIITRQHPFSTFNLFSCFNPFEWNVWLAIIAVLIHSGIIIYMSSSVKTSKPRLMNPAYEAFCLVCVKRWVVS